MYQSHTTALTLLVDPERGRVLDAPPRAQVSERWADSHPFVRRSRTHLWAGPDAAVARLPEYGDDFVTYRIEGRAFGSLDLIREN